MYQRIAKQRNKTNLVMISFFLSRSSSKLRPKPSQSVCLGNLKCAIWGQYAKSGEQKTFRISKEPRAENLQKVASWLNDEVYTQIADLDTPSKMFAGDLFCHENCYANYTGESNKATSTPNTSGRTKSKTKRDIFKNYFQSIKSTIYQGSGFFSIRHQGHDQSK